MAAPRNDNIREKILEGTARLLENQAFSEISLHDIARETGVSKGSIYYYYNEKSDILFDVTDRCLESLYGELSDWFERRAENVNITSLSGYVLRRGIFDSSGRLQLQLLAEAASGNTEIAQKIRRIYTQFKETLAAKIHECNPEADNEYHANMLLVLHNALLLHHYIDSGLMDVEKFIQTFVAQMSELDSAQ